MRFPAADHPAVLAAVRHGLGAVEAPVNLESSAVEEVLRYARFDRLSGFLADAVHDGLVVVDDAVRQDVDNGWHEALLASVVVESLVVRTAAVLDEAGVEWLLSKGAAVAHLDYPDPGVRTFGDADIIVHPRSWSDAVAALIAAGHTRQFAALGERYESRYGKGATLGTADGLEVDLHRRFAIGRFAVRSRMEDVFEQADHIVLAGRKVPVPTAPYRLLHACYHASLGGFRELRAFRDVAQLLLVTEADWAATLAVARRWRAEAVVHAAIIETWNRLQLGIAHPAVERARTARVSTADRRALEVFQAERPFRDQALTALGRLPPWETPRYVWALLTPRLRRRSWTR